jgi:hypothetical protein
LLFATLVVAGLAGRPAAASTFDLGTITPGDEKASSRCGVDSANFQVDLSSVSDPAASLGTFTDLSGTTLAFSYLKLERATTSSA